MVFLQIRFVADQLGLVVLQAGFVADQAGLVVLLNVLDAHSTSFFVPR